MRDRLDLRPKRTIACPALFSKTVGFSAAICGIVHLFHPAAFSKSCQCATDVHRLYSKDVGKLVARALSFSAKRNHDLEFIGRNATRNRDAIARLEPSGVQLKGDDGERQCDVLEDAGDERGGSGAVLPILGERAVEDLLLGAQPHNLCRYEEHVQGYDEG